MKVNPSVKCFTRLAGIPGMMARVDRESPWTKSARDLAARIDVASVGTKWVG